MPASSTTPSVTDAVKEAAYQEHKANGHDPRPVATEADGDMDTLFHALAQNWLLETGMLSNLKQRYMNPHYQQIIGLGPAVVPVILRELKSHPNHWFWALRAITRVNPAPAESAGKTQQIAHAWIRWGEENGYC